MNASIVQPLRLDKRVTIVIRLETNKQEEKNSVSRELHTRTVLYRAEHVVKITQILPSIREEMQVFRNVLGSTRILTRLRIDEQNTARERSKIIAHLHATFVRL